MNFYETNLGNRFFNAQLPALIQALNQIAEALQKPAVPAIQLPVDVPADYLAEVYYGNLEPDTKIDSEEIRQYSKTAIGLQDKLKQQLSEENWALVEQLMTTIDSRSCAETAKGFQTGFCTAIQMVAAGLSTSAATKKCPNTSEEGSDE